jgi:hypothetical protein
LGDVDGVCFSRPVRQRTRQVLGPGPLLGPLFSLRSNTLPECAVTYPMV